jgi:hypothetical protein
MCQTPGAHGAQRGASGSGIGGDKVQRYQIVPAFVHATIAGLLYLFLRYVAVIDQYAFADYIRAGAVFLLPFLFNRSAFIANLLIEKVPLLSVGIRRLLSGSDFIEGDWPLVVMEEGQPIPKYFGFLTIAYEGGQLVVYGDDWNPDGSHAVKFRSQQSSYDNRKLQYWYAQGATMYEPTMFGYTRIYFFPERGRIERHAGEFLDKQHTSPPFYAQRLRYRPWQRHLAADAEKFAAAKRLWAEIEPSITATQERRIDRDFI